MDKNNNPFKDNVLFSNSKPNLISEKCVRKLDKILENVKTTSVTSHMSNIYNDYIKPNLFGILVVVFIGIFLLIMYIVKKYKEENYEDIKEEDTIETEDIDRLEAERGIDDVFDDENDDIIEDDPIDNDSDSEEIGGFDE